MSNTTKSIDDAVKCRLYAKGIWKLDTVAHFGGDETDKADMCLLRDTDGKPFIPGASITGAARSFLARQCLTWDTYKKGITAETPELKRLFGGASKDDTMSALIVADASCVSAQVITSIRDGVRIDVESGTAVDKAKFDVEIIERGTEFELNLGCIIRYEDDNVELTRLFLALLHAFEQGNIRLGARTRRGYGRGKVKSWETGELQMNNTTDVLTWLRNDSSMYTQNPLTPTPLQSDKRNYIHIAADFELCTSLLIRSASIDPNAPDDEVPDTTHLHSNEKPIVPGTSFAGAFRHRAALIATALKWQKNSKDAVCEIFGPIHKQDSDVKQQTDLWISRVQIEERLVKRVDLQWQDRVAIDRFTGGSLQSALFDEKPIYPLSLKELEKKGKKQGRPNIRLRLTLEEPEKAEIGLLLLTLRDFWHGHAALGGETSNGRGTLRGIKAKLIYKDNPNPSDLKVWKLVHKDKRMAIEKDDEGFLQSCVEEAQNYSGCPSGSRRPK